MPEIRGRRISLGWPAPSFRIRGTVSGLPIAIGSDIEIQANSKIDSDIYA
jgi:hypothetical protein